ncbi:RNA polymerase sigma factor [Amycolatopsis thailandensis]|uniref:RNA polymerase sigma factor n=1 Tax=Amycolatopsis thailandensis TaxID=589330 RepID=UPI003635A1AB
MKLQCTAILRPPHHTVVTYSADDRDEDLERLARHGDVEAFGVLVERYSSAVYYVIHARVGDPGETERLVIEVFCAAWRDLQRRPWRHRGFLGVLSHAVAISFDRDEEVKGRNP